MHLLGVIAALALSPVALVHAQSMEPLSYTNSPIGLNFLTAGYDYQSGNVLVDPVVERRASSLDQGPSQCLPAAQDMMYGTIKEKPGCAVAGTH